MKKSNKTYTLPVSPEPGEPQRTGIVGDGTWELHNPEWNVDFHKSLVNQEFIAGVVAIAIANLQVSVDISIREV